MATGSEEMMCTYIFKPNRLESSTRAAGRSCNMAIYWIYASFTTHVQKSFRNRESHYFNLS